MVTFLTVLQFLAAILIVICVLLQPAKAGGSSPFGGTSQSLLGNSGGTHLLFKITMWSAFFIMASSLFVARYNLQTGRSSVVDTTTSAPALPPVAPVAPTAPEAAAPAAPADNAAEKK